MIVGWVGAALLSAMTPPAHGWPEEIILDCQFTEEVQVERAGDGWRVLGQDELRGGALGIGRPGPVVRTYHSNPMAATHAGHCRRAEADYCVGR